LGYYCNNPHNLIIDVEGTASVLILQICIHTKRKKRIEGQHMQEWHKLLPDGEVKHEMLIDELMEYRRERDEMNNQD